MGTFNVTIQIANLNGEHFEDVEVMADTGATTTVIPRSILTGLGIRPTQRDTFEYANGQSVNWTWPRPAPAWTVGKRSPG